MADLHVGGSPSLVVEELSECDDDGPELGVAGNMVFQCAKCNVILGDTLSWVEGNTELGTFTLKHVSGDVELSRSVHTSQEGHDEGSTYKDVRCCACKVSVGRYYLATTSDVDHLRKLYTLYSANVSVYELNCGGAADKDSLDVPELTFLNLRNLTLHVRKMQGIIMQLSAQLAKVSKAVSLPLPKYGLSTMLDDANAVEDHDASRKDGDNGNCSGDAKSDTDTNRSHDDVNRGGDVNSSHAAKYNGDALRNHDGNCSRDVERSGDADCSGNTTHDEMEKISNTSERSQKKQKRKRHHSVEQEKLSNSFDRQHKKNRFMKVSTFKL